MKLVADISLMTDLRSDTPNFPLTHERRYKSEGQDFYWISTLIPFEYQGELYWRHLVEGGALDEFYTEDYFFYLLTKSAEVIMTSATMVPWIYDKKHG